MKKTMLKLGTVLTFSALLAGCQADNAAYNRPNTPRDVNYRTGYNNPNSNAIPPASPDYTNLSNGTGNNQANQMGYVDQKKLAKKIADRASSVKGVAKAHVLVTGNTVVIGAVPEKGETNRANLRKRVRLEVLPIAGDRDVLVSTDNRYVKRIISAETNFNAGEATREVRSDIVGIVKDLSNAVQRPFKNNSR